jgi:hypothetical protein
MGEIPGKCGGHSDAQLKLMREPQAALDTVAEWAYVGQYNQSSVTMLEEQIKELQAMVSLQQDDEELSDEELEGVAGGLTTTPGGLTTTPPVMRTLRRG